MDEGVITGLEPWIVATRTNIRIEHFFVARGGEALPEAEEPERRAAGVVEVTAGDGVGERDGAGVELGRDRRLHAGPSGREPAGCSRTQRRFR